MGWASGNLDDMRAHLDALAAPGFLRETPAAALAELPRYLKALALRAERRAGTVPVTATPPDGAVVTDGPDAFLRWNGAWLRWSFGGYTPADPTGELRLLTPPSIVRMLEIGLPVTAHPSAG